MDKISLTILLGVFFFCCYAHAKNNPQVIIPNKMKFVREYCDIPDSKIRMKISIRAINRFGHIYGPQFYSYKEMN